MSTTKGPAPAPTERLHALALSLLERHGVLTREAVAAEGITGGFPAVYPILRAMEEAGRIRRGYFVDGQGAAQFALPGAVDRLRAVREPEPSEATARVLAATDPANPYGAAIAVAASRRRRSPAARRAPPARTSVLVDGAGGCSTLERGGGVDPDPAGRRRSRGRRTCRSTRSGRWLRKAGSASS